MKELKSFQRSSKISTKIDIKDIDIGWMWKISPDMNQLLGKLEAQQEVKVCMECGSHNIVQRDSYWWCNSCHLPTPGIRTRWVNLKELESAKQTNN